MTTEEFTFPISASATGDFIDSPPLWCRYVGPRRATSTSSTSTSSSSSSEEEEREHHALQRKSYSSIEGGSIDHHRLIEMDDHDRMDLLWEDFNEDPPRKRNSFMGNFGANASDDDEDEFSEFGCVSMALRLSKAVTGVAPGGDRAVIASNKKLRLLVLAKVFKRLFLLQHQSVKKRSW